MVEIENDPTDKLRVLNPITDALLGLGIDIHSVVNQTHRVTASQRHIKRLTLILKNLSLDHMLHLLDVIDVSSGVADLRMKLSGAADTGHLTIAYGYYDQSKEAELIQTVAELLTQPKPLPVESIESHLDLVNNRPIGIDKSLIVRNDEYGSYITYKNPFLRLLAKIGVLNV